MLSFCAVWLSWIIDDINPEYTMGSMARKRNEIIAQLKSEGVFELQRELCLPLFAQRIAVISFGFSSRVWRLL